MNRWPLVASFILFIALCASIAYWAMQLFKPPLRPVAAPPRAAKTEVNPEAAAALFGGRGSKAAVASNYQLKGVIMSGTARDSVAILSTEGKPEQAIRVNMEVMPGVTVKEVHREYVLLSEDGVTKRVELPEAAEAQPSPAISSPVRTQPAAPAQQRLPTQRPPGPTVSPAPRPQITQPVVPPQPAPQPQSVPPQAVQPQPVQPQQPQLQPQLPQQPQQPVPPGAVPGAPTGSFPAPATTTGGTSTQAFNPPPSPEPAPANPPASPEPTSGGMPAASGAFGR